MDAKIKSPGLVFFRVGCDDLTEREFVGGVFIDCDDVLDGGFEFWGGESEINFLVEIEFFSSAVAIIIFEEFYVGSGEQVLGTPAELRVLFMMVFEIASVFFEKAGDFLPSFLKPARGLSVLGHVGEGFLDDVVVLSALKTCKQIDGEADLSEFFRRNVPVQFDYFFAEAYFVDECASVGFDGVDVESSLLASIDELKEFTNF